MLVYSSILVSTQENITMEEEKVTTQKQLGLDRLDFLWSRSSLRNYQLSEPQCFRLNRELSEAIVLLKPNVNNGLTRKILLWE